MSCTLKLLLRIFYLNTLILGAAHAQTLKSDSIANSPIEQAEALFHSGIKQQSRLLNGIAFKNYASNVEGSANFQDLVGFTNGDVVYDGLVFNNIPIMYDLYEDKVISLFSKSTMFSLISEKVSDFYLNNHHFRYINIIDTTKSVVKSGFFDVIYDGKIKILVKRSKKIQLSLGSGDLTYYFVPKTNYYLEMSGDYVNVDSEKSFLELFKDKKTELKQHLKAEKIKFKKAPEEAMIRIATYYENLLP